MKKLPYSELQLSNLLKATSHRKPKKNEKKKKRNPGTKIPVPSPAKNITDFSGTLLLIF